VLRGKRKGARGYAVAVLVGLEAGRAVLWRIFSNVVKPDQTVTLSGVRSDTRALYSFHESVVDALRPVLKEGVRSVVLVSPPRTNYPKAFAEHVRLHHAWLSQGAGKVVFSELTGSADTLAKVAELVKRGALQRVVSEAVVEEAEGLAALFEKRLNAAGNDGGALVAYSLVDAESAVYGEWVVGKPQPEFLLVTNAFVSGFRSRGRLQRLMQIAANKGVKVRVVDVESAIGARVAQFGGLVLLMKN